MKYLFIYVKRKYLVVVVTIVGYYYCNIAIASMINKLYVYLK